MTNPLPKLDLSQITTVAIDLDGTSIIYNRIDPSLTYMHPYTGKIINALVDTGIEVIIATGRTHTNVEMVRNTLEKPFTLVAYNGAMIEIPQPDGSTELIVHPISKDTFPEIRAALPDYDFMVNAYSQDQWYVNLFPEEEARRYTGTRNHYNYVSDLSYLERDDIIKIYIKIYNGDQDYGHGQLTQARDHIRQNLSDQVDCVFSGYRSIDINAFGVNKFTTIATYMANKGQDATKNLLAIGDSMNDYPMIAQAKYGFYMENSLDELKQALANHEHCYEIGSNKELATAKFLNELFNLGLPCDAVIEDIHE